MQYVLLVLFFLVPLTGFAQVPEPPAEPAPAEPAPAEAPAPETLPQNPTPLWTPCHNPSRNRPPRWPLSLSRKPHPLLQKRPPLYSRPLNPGLSGMMNRMN